MPTPVAGLWSGSFPAKTNAPGASYVTFDVFVTLGPQNSISLTFSLNPLKQEKWMGPAVGEFSGTYAADGSMTLTLDNRINGDGDTATFCAKLTQTGSEQVITGEAVISHYLQNTQVDDQNGTASLSYPHNTYLRKRHHPANPGHIWE
jgi:hypothetical protein